MSAKKKMDEAGRGAAVKKPAAGAPAASQKRAAERGPAPAKPAVKAHRAPVAPPAEKRPAGPTARTCPLVLDGEVEADDFSPSDCLTCEEFDCRFCEAAEGSGALRSRLFAADEEGDDGDDGWGRDLDTEGGVEAGGDEEGDEEDPF